MKKTMLSLAIAFVAMTSANAQTKLLGKLADLNILNHLTVGLNVGTTGIGADVSMPCTPFVDFEAGFTIMPKIKYSTDIHPNVSSYTEYTGASSVVRSLGLSNVPIQGKLNMVNGKFLINVYPVPKLSNFHITAGAYFGRGNIVDVYNTVYGQLSPINTANNEIANYNLNYAIPNNLPTQQRIGVELGDYLLTPNAFGNASASLKTHGFKPYLGIGFGRATTKTKRIGFKFDLGALFWGSPEIVDHNGVSLSKQNWNGKDGGAFRVISKIKVYPVLNFRLCGRIF
ncbi:MAG: hypothetical protein IKQ37_01385 [Bacteroidaceae bacterium]|nr:hypothetical protein [Bacteroidaceae bacterium]